MASFYWCHQGLSLPKCPPSRRPVSLPPSLEASPTRPDFVALTFLSKHQNKMSLLEEPMRRGGEGGLGSGSQARWDASKTGQKGEAHSAGGLQSFQRRGSAELPGSSPRPARDATTVGHQQPLPNTHKHEHTGTHAPLFHVARPESCIRFPEPLSQSAKKLGGSRFWRLEVQN